MFNLNQLSAEIEKFTLNNKGDVQLTIVLSGSKVDLEKLKMLKQDKVYVDLTSAQQTLELEEEEVDTDGPLQ
ncbi:hypothetical protein FC36_GL001374 [Ligilactobacillus equi DSM 15833 = JCM 10991]|uniref:Uncharacterized protein n=1 Tax=Ligilactobacillus equi DSM 15833 = JCM 10991 TaxID=1423740 RepID=A0A0R1TKL3_9LACO|nr:hypothetical protein [Ligilactobacillus equi]KRL81782.1 hypothetical protein FC36_GL001374 [Ligilactobacillus equi DSM 15833 = JCM 10991]